MTRSTSVRRHIRRTSTGKRSGVKQHLRSLNNSQRGTSIAQKEIKAHINRIFNKQCREDPKECARFKKQMSEEYPVLSRERDKASQIAFGEDYKDLTDIDKRDINLAISDGFAKQSNNAASKIKEDLDYETALKFDKMRDKILLINKEFKHKKGYDDLNRFDKIKLLKKQNVKEKKQIKRQIKLFKKAYGHYPV